MLRRRWPWIVVGLTVTLLLLGAWSAFRQPREAIFVSFSQSDRWSYTATTNVYRGVGLAAYGVYSGLQTREPWAIARPKIERDLTAAGFVRHGGTPRFALWQRPGARAFVLAAGHDPSAPQDLTTVSLTRNATVLEAGRSWLRDRLSHPSPRPRP